MNNPICVVKLETEAYKRGNKYFYGKSIRVIKSKTTFDLLEEEVQNIGIVEGIENIINLHECDTGMYWLAACNISRDIESGYIDDWNLKLVPYKENE